MERKLPRRDFIKAAGITVAGSVLAAKSGMLFAEDVVQPFELPALPYAYNALEPHIDALTMEIHHDRHHKAYVDNLNKAVIENKIEERNLEKLITNAGKYPLPVRNNGGGHYNHSFFWKLMKPNGGGVPKGNLWDAMESVYGTFENFQTSFNEVAMSRFGSGWAWLAISKGRLMLISTPNQDNPLMDDAEVQGNPILALDVWEHAYYLQYQNKRKDYVNAWWNLINWDQAEKNFIAAR